MILDIVQTVSARNKFLAKENAARFALRELKAKKDLRPLSNRMQSKYLEMFQKLPSYDIKQKSKNPTLFVAFLTVPSRADTPEKIVRGTPAATKKLARASCAEAALAILE